MHNNYYHPDSHYFSSAPMDAYQAWWNSQHGNNGPTTNRAEETPRSSPPASPRANSPQANSSPAASPPPSHSTTYEDSSAAAGWGRHRHSGSSMAKKLRSFFGLGSKNRGRNASTSRYTSSAEAGQSSNSRRIVRELSPSPPPSPPPVRANLPVRSSRDNSASTEYESSRAGYPQLPRHYGYPDFYPMRPHQPYDWHCSSYAMPHQPYDWHCSSYAMPHQPYDWHGSSYAMPHQPHGWHVPVSESESTAGASSIRIVKSPDTNGCTITSIAMVAKVSYSEARQAAINDADFVPGGRGLEFSKAQTVLKNSFGVESTLHNQPNNWSEIPDFAIVTVSLLGMPHAVVFVRSNGRELIYDSNKSGPEPRDGYQLYFTNWERPECLEIL
jgi:hypothetical protein